MTTRLDRLFLLLETGSTPVIRKSAAEQLGEVQKLHPHELNNLLSKVHCYLGNTSWETRIAAGQAVEAIARNVPQWEPNGRCKKEGGSSDLHTGGKLRFTQFDIARVLQNGASLLASEGGEFDYEEDAVGVDLKKSIAKQRQLLNKRLGLDVAGNLGMETDIFDDNDLIMKKAHNKREPQANKNQRAVAELVEQQMLSGNPEMSAREKNRAKRKAKLLAKQFSKDGDTKTNGDGSESEQSSKKRKITSQVVVDQPASENKIVVDSVVDNTLNMEEMEEWPFEDFCELLMNDLFHTSWERRHGAATGLREIIKLHGQGAGRALDITLEKMDMSNQLWLEDLCLRLLCVLALDRFGDFVADEVVAPVRETCAQVLGVALRCMSAANVKAVLQVIMQLLAQGHWEVRHGGLLGLKYLLAVRKDMTPELLPGVLPAIYDGIQDRDDDVRAVAAATLVPVTDTLIAVLPQQIPGMTICLWNILLDLDDLTASTNSIMTLLSTLLSHPSGIAAHSLTQSLTELVPRLWPFLRHNIASVRKSSLQTLHTLLTSSSLQCQSGSWLPPILPDALRHVYQRSLLEHHPDILRLVYQVWCMVLEKSPLDYLVAASSPWLGVWLCLMMQPSKVPFDPNLLLEAKHKSKDRDTPTKQRFLPEPVEKQHLDHIGGHETLNLPQTARDAHVVKARIFAGKCLGLLCRYITQAIPNYPAGTETPLESLDRLFLFHLGSKSAVQRLSVAFTIKSWADADKSCVCSEVVKTKLLGCLNEAVYYDEIAATFTRLQTDCRDFLALLKQHHINMEQYVQPGSVLTLEQARALCTTTFDLIKAELPELHLAAIESRRQGLLNTVSQTNYEQQTLNIRVQASLAGTMVSLQHLPAKLNPVIRPIMEALKREENAQLQELAAAYLSQLLHLCVSRTPCPNPKVIKNLCSSLCADPSHTPGIEPKVKTAGKSFLCSSLCADPSHTPGIVPQVKTADSGNSEALCDKHSGILTLALQQKALDRGHSRRGGGRRSAATAATLDVPLDSLLAQDQECDQVLQLQRRGASYALTKVAEEFHLDLPVKLPTFWDGTVGPLSAVQNTDFDTKVSEAAEGAVLGLTHSLQVLETIGPSIHTDLQPQLLDRLPNLCWCLEHPYTSVRHMSSRCLSMLSRISTSSTMNYLLERAVPQLGASDNDVRRQGAMEAIANVIEGLGVSVVPYIVLLVVPVLGRMSDQLEVVRLMATHCFATLIRLMPLEAGIPDPPEMKADLVQQKEQQRQFLEQLLDGSKVQDYKVPVPIKAELRKYQHDGVNWMAFLNKYNLHGILCDDMGLGKTLQSICILAADHHYRMEKYKVSQSADCAALPSIVVCPPTLTGHWVYEVEKFISSTYLNPLHYTGPPAERNKLRSKVKKHNLVVASYDIVRNDIDFFSDIRWNYCILDEGHIIKNGKTKISKAVKQLNCNHRLILTGTPIQNNVLELWSLFDFLLPGFLGTERQFQTRYGKPILQSRDAKSSSKEQEAGALAMESLHRQVLPFLLRRLKEDVLQDLPPKIIQDYYCDLSPLQIQLYEDFAKSQAKRGLEQTVGMEVEEEAENEEKKTKVQGTHHVFQALQYLRKVCNHPALVLNPKHPEYEGIMVQLKQQRSNLHDTQHAAKLTALKQLLVDCGIGVTGQDMPVVNQHRALIFCQLKSMLDIVEKDLLKGQMPGVTYLRLDGSVPAGNRHGIVSRFNNDPSIDVLLLTTHVGGLGLNLTGADTVIFVEHDWNPMKDLQAMDRAHRIGQKKVVNVYRLITRGSLEEKIMGLQKFKLNIANTVISQENSSLGSMGTDQLLDLFTLDSTSKGHQVAKSSQENLQSEQGGKVSFKAMLENFGELWDEKQYETEYNLDTFMSSLKK